MSRALVTGGPFLYDMAKKAALIAITALALNACCPKIYEKIIREVEYRDTTIYKETVRDTTVYVPIPLESGQVIVQVGDTSHLETSVAESDAFVGADGFLHHTIRNKSEKMLPVIVPIRDRYAYSNQVKTVTLTKTEYKDRPLTWWQKFRLKGFWWLLAGLAASLVWIFRKPLLSLLRRLLV